MIMQVLSQGPSLLLSVWTGLALLEGGASGPPVPPYSVSISGSSSIGFTTRLRLTCWASGTVDWYHWYHNRTYRYFNTSSSNSIEISSAQLTNSGVYYCEACNRRRCTLSSSGHRVTVTAPSSATISGSSTVGYAQRLNLTCSVSGIANSYQWYRNNIRLLGTSSHYLKSAQSRDSGSYRCKACNWAGCTGYSSSHTVTVIVPPSSVWIRGRSQVRYTHELSLTCYTLATVDNYKWYLNNSKLINRTSHYYKSSAQLSDSGSYQCEACNLGGCSPKSSSYPVRVTDVPDAVDVSSIEVTNTTFDTISIQWTPPNRNYDSIIEYRVEIYRSGGLVFTPSQPMVTLASLQPFTTYQIRISARNNAGWGSKSGLRNVNTITRDEVLASNITYSTPRVGVSTYTVELKWMVPEECLTDKLEGYKLSRWPTNTTNIETTTVNRDNVSCAWNVNAIGSETYCHEWEGFSPGSQYILSLEIVYNYSILSTGGPTNVTITIPTLPPSQDVGTVGLALGVVMGVLLAVLVIVVTVLVVLLICKKCQRRKTIDTDTAVLYNVNKDVSGNPLETVQFEPAYGGNDYTLTDDPRYVNEDFKMSRDPHCVSEDRVTSQKQNYSSLDLKSVQTSAYASLAFYQNSSTAISKYRDNTNSTKEYYEFPEKVVPQKKPSTQRTDEYANWNVISQQHGEGDQSSIDRKSSNKIPSTSGPGVKEVGKETTAPRKSQIFPSDVTMPTKKEDVSDAHHLMKHEKRENVPPPTKQRPKTNKKQPTLPPTQESATPKPQARPQQPNPVMTGSPLDAPPIPPKTKKRSLLPKKALSEQSTDTEQSPWGPNVTELRKIIEKKYSDN